MKTEVEWRGQGRTKKRAAATKSVEERKEAVGKAVAVKMEAVSGDGEAETKEAVKTEADWREPSIPEL